MPPPHFSTIIGGASQQSHQLQQSTSTLSVTDLPKPYRTQTREALQHIQTALTTEDEATSQSTALRAFQAIKKLVEIPELLYKGDEESNKLVNTRARVLSSDGPGTSAGTSSESAQIPLGKQVRTVLDTSLFNFFSDEMDQDSHSRRQLLISFLFALLPILDPRCVALQWWDILLRPMLKNPHCNVSVSRKAQHLVIWAMGSTPQAAYVDEPPLSAVWPPSDQSATVAAASPRASRKPGDAPYPASSTRSISRSQSSDDGEARFSALFSTPSKKTGPVDPMKRFTQRIFDLYTSEASSASLKTVEDDEIEDIEESNEEEEEEDGEEETAAKKAASKATQIAGLDLDLVGPTWKGNLEAIILTFGEQRPKPFFHHLSEAFVEPQSRVPILLLLTIFFRLYSSYAYHMVHTPFVRLLILSLQLDTSKTSTSLGILALVTLIPHFPNYLAGGLAGGIPALLSIFARIVEWKKLTPGWEDRSNGVGGSEVDRDDEEEWQERLTKRLQLRKGLEWKRLESSYDTAHSQRPNAEKLFTVLYGIFPCNVIRFLRAPIDYLRKAEYQSPFEADWEDIIDENTIQQKSAPILRRHLLHPALVEMDAEREISDTQRWSAHDAANTTADCASLFVGNIDNNSPSSSYDSDSRMMQARSYSGSSSFDADSTFYTNFDVVVGQEQRRYTRPRSVSENLGRLGRSPHQANLINSNFATPLVSRKRETSVHFSPQEYHDSSIVTSPRRPSTWDRQSQDDSLRAHVTLRSGAPLSGVRATSSSGIETPVKASNLRTASSVMTRSFNAPQTTLSSTIMSPSRSGNGPTSGLAHSVSVASNSPSPEIDTGLVLNGEKVSLGSPALSLNSSSPIAVKKAKVSYLKQENLQLRNELNYEIGQKDQLLRHIGTIHGKRVQDTAMEEALQNLYHTVRSQKLQLKNLKDELDNSKAEARQSKNRQVNWQADLTTKLKSMREEKKAWGNEVRILKIDKEDREELIKKLELQLDENAGELFELKETVKVNLKKVESIRDYEDKIRRLEKCLIFWDDDMKVFEKQKLEMRKVSSRWEEMCMMVEAGDSEVRSIKKRLAEVENEKNEWQIRANEATEALVHWMKKKSLDSRMMTMNASSSNLPSIAAGLEREAGEKSQMKKRIEELEVQLLDAKVRQEQLLAAKVQTQHQHHHHHDEEEDEQQGGVDPLLLVDDHEIAPLDLDDVH